ELALLVHIEKLNAVRRINQDRRALRVVVVDEVDSVENLLPAGCAVRGPNREWRCTGVNGFKAAVFQEIFVWRGGNGRSRLSVGGRPRRPALWSVTRPKPCSGEHRDSEQQQKTEARSVF